jgi:hypothetical protein
MVIENEGDERIFVEDIGKINLAKEWGNPKEKA